jgi:hypothetical protein
MSPIRRLRTMMIVIEVLAMLTLLMGLLHLMARSLFPEIRE